MSKAAWIGYFGDSHSVLTFGKTVIPLIQKIDGPESVHSLNISGLKLSDIFNWKNNYEFYRIKNTEYTGNDYHEFDSVHNFGQSFDLKKFKVLFIALGTNDFVDFQNDSTSRARLYSEKWRIAFSGLPSQQLKIFIEPPFLLGSKSQNCQNKIRFEWIQFVHQVGGICIRNFGICADQKDEVHLTESNAKNWAYLNEPYLKSLRPLILSRK